MTNYTQVGSKRVNAYLQVKLSNILNKKCNAMSNSIPAKKESQEELN